MEYKIQLEEKGDYLEIYVVEIKDGKSTQVTISRNDPRFLAYRPLTEPYSEVRSFILMPKDMALAIAQAICSAPL